MRRKTFPKTLSKKWNKNSINKNTRQCNTTGFNNAIGKELGEETENPKTRRKTIEEFNEIIKRNKTNLNKSIEKELAEKERKPNNKGNQKQKTKTNKEIEEEKEENNKSVTEKTQKRNETEDVSTCEFLKKATGQNKKHINKKEQSQKEKENKKKQNNDEESEEERGGEEREEEEEEENEEGEKSTGFMVSGGRSCLRGFKPPSSLLELALSKIQSQREARLGTWLVEVGR
jgi:hypothetical protein